MIRDSLAGIWHCLRVSALYIIWKLCCKFVFYNEVSSQSIFCQLWQDEVRMQLLAKGALLIRDAKLLDPITYSDFIAALVSLQKRI
jgi:hypothetical protein